MFKVGQKFRADAIRMSDDEEFTVTALYVELEVIDRTKVILYLSNYSFNNFVK